MNSNEDTNNANNEPKDTDDINAQNVTTSGDHLNANNDIDNNIKNTTNDNISKDTDMSSASDEGLVREDKSDNNGSTDPKVITIDDNNEESVQQDNKCTDETTEDTKPLAISTHSPGSAQQIIDVKENQETTPDGDSGDRVSNNEMKIDEKEIETSGDLNTGNESDVNNEKITDKTIDDLNPFKDESDEQCDDKLDDKNPFANNDTTEEKSETKESGESNVVTDNDKVDVKMSENKPDSTVNSDNQSTTVSPAKSPKFNAIPSDLQEVINDNSISDEVKFGLLCAKLMSITSSESSQEANPITDHILHLLITDDLQRIRKPQTLRLFFRDYLKLLPSKIVAEILSVLIAVFKKSLLNLEAAKGLLLDSLTQTFHFDNLIKHFIREIINLQTSYSCDVKELRALLKQSEDDPRLLHYIRNANLLQRSRPNAFYAFPGSMGSVLAMPPIQKWPIQNGWTFVTWFRLEPNATNSQPYLYYFRTSKSGVGYSAHFTGNCLVLTSMKVKGKGVQHCIPYEFSPFKWFHCAITYVTKWRSAEVKVYVNGQLTANTDMAWNVQTSDIFDKCYIGSTADLNESHLFCGQLSSIYLYHEALNASQICAIHRLGPSYVGQYLHSNESQIELPMAMKRVLYEEKLSSTLFSLYTPVAVEGETLCLQSAPKGNVMYFTSSPHAALLGQTIAIKTQSISSTLQSIGGIRALLPLLHRFTQRSDAEACATLIGFICDLLESSPQWFGNEVVQSHGFVIISSLLAKSPRILINEETLDILLNLTKTLISAASGADSILLKQLMDSVLFNAFLWIYVDSKLQLRLYCFLATEFISGTNNTNSNNGNNSGSNSVSNGIVFSEVRRISTVLQLLHSLKYYYWLSEEKTIQVKAKDKSLRPNKSELLSIRSYILLFIKQLILKGNGVHLDELQAILNYLTTVNEDENILDVLQMLQSLMCEHPASMIPAFDAKHGVKTVFKLIDSSNEEIRIQALKLLGYFLSRSTQKRKQDVMGPHNLYMLLCEHLMKYTPLSLETYNALHEILTETAIETIRASHSNNASLRIENPMVLKVIATLLIEGKKEDLNERDDSSPDIKRLFISDLWRLLVNNRENRRLVLQMSVWQHWLINLIDHNIEVTKDQILAIFRILLYHAIKYEYGGWRVWIDTLAIIHAKVSLDEFMDQFGRDKAQRTNDIKVERRTSGDSSTGSNSLKDESIQQKTDVLDNKKITERTSEVKSHDNEDYENRPEDDPRPEDDRELNNVPSVATQQSEDTIDNKESLTSDKSAKNNDTNGITSLDESSTNDNEEENEEQNSQKKEAFISTISSIDTQSKLSETDPKTMSTTNVPDSAPSRHNRFANRRTNPQKEFYSSLILGQKTTPKVSATPAFRIPEFRWSQLHLKLLNDLLFSVECDLQMWRSQCSEYKSESSSQRSNQLDQILQHSENQIYIVNAIHLVSQLSDNIIISAGGLLPLLAAATGGNSANTNVSAGGEGLTAIQANSLLYRLVNLIDILCFAATHVNFSELEAEKNMSAGGILRQCLRLVCTVAVKNCLTVQKHIENGLAHESDVESIEMNDNFNTGTSIAAAAELFGIDFTSESSDLVTNFKIDGSDTETVSTFIPIQPLPIKDPMRLLQEMDVNRLRACIYRDADADTRQSQFLALATLYFISVLMVSKYRDIIEPKGAQVSKGSRRNSQVSNDSSHSINEQNIDSGSLDPSEIIKPIEIPKTHVDSNIGEKLTAKLETTLSSVCPLLREIMCDFANFLSKTLLGSHGQDLVSKEAVRTFRRTNASPVELVMLLCSQEWQNTLQKNAGLAFIELINEGRLLSHAMKDHIVRVAMEAEFILNRLRADDVSKHETFTLSCYETQESRTHEETLINSLILSAKRRDWMVFTRFKENLKRGHKKQYKLDSWEDDARRKRRFICDPFGVDQIPDNSQTTSVDGSIQSKNISDESHSENHMNKTSEDLMANPIVSPKQTLNTSRIEEEDNELYLWESEESAQESETNPEFSGSVLFTIDCCLIWGIYAIEGILQITANELFFEAHSSDIELNSALKFDKKMSKSDTTDNIMKGLSGIGSKGSKGFKDLDLMVLRYCDLLTYNGKILLNEIRAIFTRRFLLQQNAVEIFLAQRTSIMFAFADYDTVKKVVKYLPPVGVGVKYGIPQSRRASLMSPKQLFATSNMTQKWQKREISNFEYLMFLNTIAGRTYQDLNQYPVFPWILTNYESNELDLAQPTNFRDLSKPIGALNSDRRSEFIERFNSWDNSNNVPAFHYGTHYSTAAFTLGWLIRLQPFYSTYLSLQDGRLEDESRLFTSVRDAWIASLMGGQQNVKELIPEFFYLPEIFNNNHILDDVELPVWAESPEHFIRLHRMALESDLVSCQLHQWIDLIFGYKQRGPEAIRAVNVFYYLTYEGNTDLSNVTDPALKEAIESQIRHFGQTPSQLTSEPHPPRSSALHVSPLMFSPVMDEVCMSVKFPFNAAVTHVASCSTHSTQPNTASQIVTINSHQQYYLHKWNVKETTSPLTMDTALVSNASNMKRQLLDTTNLCTSLQCHYIVTLDAKHIIMCPFYDNSFRVYSTETGKLNQIIYGHRGIVSCLTRSECNIAADFYVASGSQDCSVLLWTWNAKYAQIEGNGASNLSNPLPKLTLWGHQSTIISILISAELGIIVSASRNTILIHTTTHGECITEIDIRKRGAINTIRSISSYSDTNKSDEQIESRPEGQINEANLEASMLGKEGSKSIRKQSQDSRSDTKVDTLSMTSNDVNTDYCSAFDETDYLINNLVLCRELGFIVGIAIPQSNDSDYEDPNCLSQKHLKTSKNERQENALIFSYNLRAKLIKCVQIGNISFLKDRDSTLLLSTRDGEYIVMTENGTTIKILRTFDLTPLYALNTTELSTTFTGEQNRIKSLTLIDFKYLLVGLENGKLIIYNIDFNRWHHEYSSRY
ncbi:neurobeachin-like isoform X2 [Oppia nitens]|uniref:neurobeachin-like isoform X2 n=1 Tax=Oppia nitens TaxID=1686743 RepID=UPI0023D9D764|nr:neurobeachin-like isoform X2 [Oppia nitens]